MILRLFHNNFEISAYSAKKYNQVRVVILSKEEDGNSERVASGTLDSGCFGFLERLGGIETHLDTMHISVIKNEIHEIICY